MTAKAGWGLRLWPACAVLALGVGLPLASAANLPLTSSALFVQYIAASPVIPGYLVQDDFGGNGPLDGRPADVGGTWSDSSGLFQVDSGSVGRQGNNKAEAAAWIDPGTERVRIAATIETNGKYEMGLMGMLEPTFGNHIRLAWSGNQSGVLELILVNGTNETVLGTSGSIGGQVSELSLTIDSPVVTASAGGVDLSVTLTPAQVALLPGTGTGIWLEQFGSNDSFTGFTVEALP